MPPRTIDLPALKGRDIDRELTELTRPAPDARPAPDEPQAEKKKKRGRPRKKPEPEPEPEEPEEWDDYMGEPEEFGMVGADVLLTTQMSAEDKKRKINKIGIIHDLRAKLYAVGSGMKPHVEQTDEMLDAEIDLLNSEINSRRGDAAVKQITLMLMPLLEQLIDRAVPKDKFDVTGLQEEVNENWEILDDACKHISILHRDWFEVSPYAEWCKGVYTCAFSRNMKNQMRRRLGPEAEEESRLEEDIEHSTD